MEGGITARDFLISVPNPLSTMSGTDFTAIVREAWAAYDPSTPALGIEDISAQVSTNHVYKVTLAGRRFVVGKVSYFGKYEHFREDHTIINTLAKTLQPPYTRLLARALRQQGEVFTYRQKGGEIDVWVVFYNPIRIHNRFPRRLEPADIQRFGGEMARFHRACADAVPHLPLSSKTLEWDIRELLERVTTAEWGTATEDERGAIRTQCQLFLAGHEACGAGRFLKMPVFVDWNIGNFSLDDSGALFSRWDYDWFRMSSRMLDFYFFSRVVSDRGDRTTFSYVVDTLTEPRFLLFLKAYHAVYPLEAGEVRFLKEAYRFFILNYVIKYGRHFFRPRYADQLQSEAFTRYFPEVDVRFDADLLLNHLSLR
jgi:Ser/Thr protein kinase RdoA (MazF antagonist)